MDSCDSNGRSRRDGQNQTMNSNHAYQTVGLPQGLFECESGCLIAHFRLPLTGWLIQRERFPASIGFHIYLSIALARV